MLEKARYKMASRTLRKWVGFPGPVLNPLPGNMRYVLLCKCRAVVEVGGILGRLGESPVARQAEDVPLVREEVIGQGMEGQKSSRPEGWASQRLWLTESSGELGGTCVACSQH